MTQNNPNLNTIDNDPEAFDTKGLLLAYLTNWKWFVVSVILCVIAACFYIATVIPVYNVKSSIYLSQNTNSSAFSLGSEESLVSMKSFIDETELEIMKSRNNVVKIVDSLNLCYSYYYKGTFRNVPLYENNPVEAKLDSTSLRVLRAPINVEVTCVEGDSLYDIKVSTSREGVKERKTLNDVTLPCTIELSNGSLTLERNHMIANMEHTEIITIVNPRTMASRISGSLNIEFAKMSEQIVRVSVMTNIPAKGVDIINALVDFYNRDIIEDKNRSAVQTEAFILDRLVMISDDLRDVENRLQEYRQAHNVTNINAQNSLNLSLQSNYQNQLAEAEADLVVLDEIERVVNQANVYDLLPSAVQDQTLNRIIEEYNNLVSQLNRTLEVSTPNHPLVTGMQDELSRQKFRIMSTINGAKRNLNARMANIRQLESQAAGQLSSTPTVDKGLQEIFREQQVKVNIYTFLLQRREEIALQKTLATNTARLIDDPLGNAPVKPKKLIILFVAFLLGLGIPAVIIFLRRLIFPIFSDQEELERLTSVPILGEICKAEKANESEYVVGENVSTPVAELFRLLRNNITFARHEDDNNVILVTSAIAGEGKTFVAINLALTYALVGKKVLVIGGDIRRPTLAKRLGISNKKGLTTYLSGQNKDIDQLVMKSSVNSNLDILTAGPVPPNPNELLMSPNMDELMARLKEKYDMIIIDSAPIGVISDSYLIVRFADLQLFVTRADYSSIGSLKTLHDAVNKHRLNHTYIVLNGVDIHTSAYFYRRYGSYGRKNYGYGYQN